MEKFQFTEESTECGVIALGAARGIRTPVGRPIGLAIRRNGQAMRSPQAVGPLCYLR